MYRNPGTKRWIPACLALAAAAALLTASGCAHTPRSAFYVLPDSGVEAPEPDVTRGDLISVGPVRLADYLRRPELVWRVTPVELNYEEYHRWAEPPERAVRNALTGYLSRSITHAVVLDESLASSMNPGIMVAVDILRMDGTPGTSADFAARYIIRKPGSDIPVIPYTFETSSPLDTGGAAGLVAAHGRHLEAFAGDIATHLLEAQQPKP